MILKLDEVLIMVEERDIIRRKGSKVQWQVISIDDGTGALNVMKWNCLKKCSIWVKEQIFKQDWEIITNSYIIRVKND